MSAQHLYQSPAMPYGTVPAPGYSSTSGLNTASYMRSPPVTRNFPKDNTAFHDERLLRFGGYLGSAVDRSYEPSHYSQPLETPAVHSRPRLPQTTALSSHGQNTPANERHSSQLSSGTSALDRHREETAAAWSRHSSGLGPHRPNPTTHSQLHDSRREQQQKDRHTRAHKVPKTSSRSHADY